MNQPQGRPQSPPSQEFIDKAFRDKLTLDLTMELSKNLSSVNTPEVVVSCVSIIVKGIMRLRKETD